MKKSERGKVEFTQKSQTYVDITADTANVACVERAIKNCWGESYKLVTIDGIELEDSPTTKGKHFMMVAIIGFPAVYCLLILHVQHVNLVAGLYCM